MSRPDFKIAWDAALRIYDPDNPGAKVANVIGGKIAFNINNPVESERWTNTCTVRMSYILNESGLLLPHVTGETVSGAEGRWYFFRVHNLIDYLERSWGRPDIVVNDPPSGGGELAGKKGIVLFKVSGWKDATGHATLWNGDRCYDHCYFNKEDTYYHTDSANYWTLPYDEHA